MATRHRWPTLPRLSLRATLIGGFALLLLVAMGVMTTLAVRSIQQTVLADGQARVDHDLATLAATLSERQELLARSLLERTKGWRLADADLSLQLRQARQDLGLTVLNVCAADGRPVAGGYGTSGGTVPVQHDPVLRRALEGRPAWGAVRLDEARLRLEGGEALARAVQVPSPRQPALAATSNALVWWVAQPLYDQDGRVEGLVYGGRSLNHDVEVVDGARDLLFGTGLFEHKPLGTVTLFLDGIRVATNVLGPDGTRAVGTEVSDEVRQRVIGERQTWQNRAWVVDAWYLSGYRPIRDPSGQVIGMLYVGMLEAPYAQLTRRLVLQFLGPGLAVMVLAVLASLLVIRWIGRPLRQLGAAAGQMAEGHWHAPIESRSPFVETRAVTEAFGRMRAAIQKRDHRLRERNRALAALNRELEQTNGNYLEMLGFVTHELRAPVTAIQSLASALHVGLGGEMTAQARDLVGRVHRNALEMQDMIRDYLELSRLQRGALEVRLGDCDVVADVIAPAVDLAQALFDERRMSLEVATPPELAARIDAELLRIVVVNFLSNAAKYGKPAGRVRLHVRIGEGRLLIGVWNEGLGFALGEAKELFGKFSRLRNATTRTQRGSGLGLFVCQRIAELHGGRAWAESEPGHWAEFFLEVPVAAAPSATVAAAA